MNRETVPAPARRGRPRSEKARAWTARNAPAGQTGTLPGDLLAQLRPWVVQVRDRPYGRIIAALVTEARTDPAFAEQYPARFDVIDIVLAGIAPSARPVSAPASG